MPWQIHLSGSYEILTLIRYNNYSQKIAKLKITKKRYIWKKL